MAKTDTAQSNGKQEPVASGKVAIHFLSNDAVIPERKPLGREAGTGEWTQVAKALAEKPGRVAEILKTNEMKTANARRSALINAANAAGIEMDRAKTCVRGIDGDKDAAGQQVYTVFACVATEAVKKAQAKARAEALAKLEATAKEKGMTLEQYKASLPKRGRKSAADVATESTQGLQS